MGKKNKNRAAAPTSEPASNSIAISNRTSKQTSTSKPSSKPNSTSDSTPAPPSRQPPAESAPPPISSARLPLLDLSSGDLGAFFELCFPDKRLLALCHELKLHTPGYRLEALPPDQVADGAVEVRPDVLGREVLVGQHARDLVGRQDLGQLLDLVVAG